MGLLPKGRQKFIMANIGVINLFWR